MAGAFEQFIRFGTSATGLERTFRLLQALAQTLVSFPPAHALLLTVLALLFPSDETAVASAVSALRGLRAQFALGRRFFRVFRFLDSFHAAWKLYGPASSMTAETWLAVSAASFNGMYLLLETLAFPEALGVPGVVTALSDARTVFVEAQRFWFLALVCGAAAGLAKARRLAVTAAAAEAAASGEASGAANANRAKARSGGRRVLRRLAADLLDLVVPGTVVGWVAASEGTVGAAMLVSTWLTALEVWDQCGEQLRAEEELLLVGGRRKNEREGQKRKEG